MVNKISIVSLILVLLLAACTSTQEPAVSAEADITVFRAPT